MNIAVNCWLLRNKKIDGIGNFTIETLVPLIVNHPEVKFQLLLPKNFTETYFDFPNVSKHFIFPALRHPLLYVVYMEIVLGAYLRKANPDLLLGMDGFLCLNTSVKQIPIIYDLNFEHFPKDLPLRNRFYYRAFFPRFARKATRIATISEYSKDDIVKTYSINPEKIDNVSCGIKDKFIPLANGVKAEVREKYTDGAEYFFFVGSMHPRKNIIRLIEAFDLFKKNTGSETRLVLVGYFLWDDKLLSEVMAKISCKEDIVFPGRVSDEDLALLMGAAQALAYVPVFEGFGLPIVEAFQAQVPVICSNVTSMPEVAGGAALQVNPFDINEIAVAMERMWRDESLRAELVQTGNLQRLKFTWVNTANLLWNTIEKITR